jgi:hypothetical protein
MTTYGDLAAVAGHPQAAHLLDEGVTCREYIVDNFKEHRWNPFTTNLSL